MTDKTDKDCVSADQVPRLSPREIFEDLLGEPDDRGYQEETLKEIFENARYFACDRRFSQPPTEGDGKERVEGPEEKE